MSHCEKNGDGHVCSTATSSVVQTLDEMTWERGIWNAALSGDMEKVRRMVLNGSEVGARDNAGYTALHYAARAGHVELCHFLILHGAPVNVGTKSGNSTPLHRAAAAGKDDIVNLLISSGANLHYTDADGQTALHSAAKYNRTSVYKILNDTDATLNSVKDIKLRTASDLLTVTSS